MFSILNFLLLFWIQVVLNCIACFAAGNNAQAAASQLEAFIRKVTDAMQRDSMLFDKIDKRPTETMSSRVLWWTLDLVPGTLTRQVDPDGGSAGRGAAITQARAQVQAAFFLACTEMTDLAMAATDNSKKAVADYKKRNLEKQISQFRNLCESLLNSDLNAAGILDTITSINGNAIGVNNANKFQGNKVYQVLPGVGQASLGPLTTLNIDVNAKTIYVNGALPPNIAVGNVLAVDGSPGIVNSSLGSLRSNHLDSNTGSWNNLPRGSFPGQLKTPHLAMNNFAISPSAVDLGLVYLRRVLPEDEGEALDLLMHMGFDQQQSLSNYAYLANPTIIWNDAKGDRNIDMMKKMAAATMSGYKKLVSKLATPGVIDALAIDRWFRGELQPVGPLTRNGQTEFQTYGDDGGLDFSVIEYIWGGFQVCMEQPKFGLYYDGCALPSGT
jgi:hypothetical protein